MYYKLTFEFWDFEWEDFKTFFFRTEKEAKAKQKEIEKENGNKHRRFFIEEISFEDMKKEITVESYEELFNITIEEQKQHQAKWQYWDGWCGNHDKRIEDATCSNCGYRHPIVYGSTDKLADECPCCKLKMEKK